MARNERHTDNRKHWTRRQVLSAAGVSMAGAGLCGVTASLAPVRWALASEVPKPSRLVVRAWGGSWVEALKQGVSQPFTEMTGIEVRHNLTEDNTMQQRMWAAIDQNRRPPVHVDWVTSINAAKSALHGVTASLGELDNLDGLLDFAKPSGLDGWPYVNPYSYAYVLAYRTEAFPDGPPESWRVMLDPQYKGRVGIYDDGIGFHGVAQLLGGGAIDEMGENMEPAWDTFRKLADNQPLLGEDPDFQQWFENGEVDVACTILSNARGVREKTGKVDWTVPKEGAELHTDALWVPNTLRDNELHWAKQYVNFALSAKALETWCNGLGLPPARAGLQVPDDMRDDTAYPNTAENLEHMIRIPTPVLVRNQSQWFQKVNAIMQS